MSDKTAVLLDEAVSSQANNDIPKATSVKKGTAKGALFSIVAIVLSVLYLANISFQLFEIPDIIPGIGNIDEALMTTILVSALSRFGIHLAPNLDPKRKTDN